MKEFPLARLRTKSFATFCIIEFRDPLSKKEIQRDETFRRQVKPDSIDEVELIMFNNPSNAYCTFYENDAGSNNKKWRVYTPNEDDSRVYEETSNLEDFENEWRNLPIGEENKKKLVKAKLTGSSESSLWDEEFRDTNRMDIAIDLEDRRFIMHHHKEFIRPCFLMYTPVIDKGEVEWVEIPKCSNLFFNANQPKKDSFLPINPECSLILINDFKQDVACGTLSFFDSESNELFSVENKEMLSDEQKEIIKKHAIAKSKFELIDFSDINTKLTMLWD